MEIIDNILLSVNKNDIIEDGKLIIPEGVKKINKYIIKSLHDIKMIQFPRSLEEIDYEELDRLVDLVELYIPDGIKRLDIKPYIQQAEKIMIGKAHLVAYGFYVNPWTYLRLPKGFEIKNPTTEKSEVLDTPTLVVNIENLDKIIAEKKYNEETVILNIKNVSELSVEKLKKLTEIVNIKSIQIIDIKAQSCCYETFLPYDVETYIKCREKIDEILSSIDFKKFEGMPDREKYIFGEIIKKLSHITYDKSAFRQGSLSSRFFTCRNLIGGLLDGTCVCVGYSEIIRNILACCDIESKLIAGGSHCWNQVKLDGKWYNVDFTFDQPKILKGKTPKFMLKSDKDFKYHSKMILDYLSEKKDIGNRILSQIYKDVQLEECCETVPYDKLMKYIYGESKESTGQGQTENGKYYVPLQKSHSIEVIQKFARSSKIGFTKILDVFNQFSNLRKRNIDGKNRDE